MKLVKNLLYNILILQEKILRLRLSKTLNSKYKSKRKRHYTDGCMLDLNTMAEAEKQTLENELTLILKKYNYSPTEILKYIALTTPVKYLDDAAKILNPVGENEGFIYPTKGCKALYLSLAVDKNIRLKTDAMFVLSKGEINKYYFIYHFYNWYAYMHNIAGLEADSQELLKKFLFGASDFNNLQLDDIYKLKEAIKQDKAAIEFVIKLCRNYDGAKQALSKLKSNDGAKL